MEDADKSRPQTGVMLAVLLAAAWIGLSAYDARGPAQAVLAGNILGIRLRPFFALA